MTKKIFHKILYKFIKKLTFSKKNKLKINKYFIILNPSQEIKKNKLYLIYLIHK